MREIYIFENLKDEEKLVKLLQQIWIDGVRTGMIDHDKTVSWLIENDYMPNFKEMLSK